MDIQHEIENLLTRTRAERQRVNNELKHLPRGALLISGNGKERLSYFQSRYVNGKRLLKGIGSDPWLVQQLARKAYLIESKEKLNKLEEMLWNLKNTVPSLNLNEIRKDLPKHFERIPDDWLLGRAVKESSLHPVFDGSIEPEPIRLFFEGDSPADWMAAPYCANTSHMEDLIHKAARGFYCRSKSEAADTGLYDDLGIPYHYDEVVSIRMEIISPDIRGIRRDRAFICHEHWGLKTQSYIQKNLRKLRDYASEGFIFGKNLLITYDDEAGGVNLPLIREQIKDIYHLT